MNGHEGIYERYEFRGIRPEEAQEAVEIERLCFPPNEACSGEHMLERISVAPELFVVAVEKETGRMAGFLNGIATDERAFRDAFFTDIELHDPEGDNVMLLGLDVAEEFRRQGLARALVGIFRQRAEKKGKKRLVLTCKADKVGMYQKFGFRDLGDSGSEWGGEKWKEMDLVLNRT